MNAALRYRTEAIYAAKQQEVFERIDRLFGYLMALQWLAGVLVAMVYSPRTWTGAQTQMHPHVWAAVVFGAVISGPPVALAFLAPGRVFTRQTIAVGQMLTSALLIHITGGRIETHFHIFGSLAFLAFYRDWRVLLTATVVVASDHILLGALAPVSIYGVAYQSEWRWVEHAFWVVFEDVVLVFWCRGALAELSRNSKQQALIEVSQDAAAEQQRLTKELEIASTIQTGILPRRPVVPGLEIAARMLPATEVGGDYYDVQPVTDGCWLGIGDVSGHGLTSGIIMLMMQSGVAALAAHRPDGAPGEFLRVLNGMLHENVRRRLADDNHATLSLLRYHADGRVRFAGAHEDILVARHEGACEQIATPGPWVAARRHLGATVVESELVLGVGDVMLLYTDGATEARNAAGDEFGIERLRAELSRVSAQPVDAILAHLVRAVTTWTAAQDDDVTLVVARHVGAATTP